MSLSCTFGLTACLFSQGHWIPEDSVQELQDSCPTIERFAAADFTTLGGYGPGSALAAVLWDKGLRYKSDTDPAKFKANVIKACVQLERDATDKRKWKGL